jgi:formylglycine-generating enzyme required for sulfatase activity/tRNA A-37 threonylcarbamoyl transferase component Bud32
MAKLKCSKCFHINPEGAQQCVQCGEALPRIRIEAQAPARPQTPVAHAPEIQFRQGQVVAKRYTVLKLIGRGGMGAIYKVHDNILGEEVALKTLLPQFARDKMVVERFFNEARIARRLAHPNIVRVHDIGSTGQVIYISMEFVDGKSLRAAMEAFQHGAKMPVLQTLLIMDELCAALEYAHSYTVHRDLKPENVMIDKTGVVKLMDFGISKLMADTRLTGASVVMGTPFYMAPEQLRNSRDVDVRADIYSMGVMLYEVLTGNVPTGVPKPLSEILQGVPKQLDKIVQQCVEPEPKDRFQNVAELRAALSAVQQDLDNATKTSRWRPRTTHSGEESPGRMRRVLGVAAALLILTGMAGALYAVGQRPAGQSPTTILAPVAPVLPASASPYEVLAATVEEVRAHAATRVNTRDEGALSQAFAAGDQLWEEARAARASGGSEAERLAHAALQTYLGLFIWPEGMVFVPAGYTATEPGGERIWVAPFFIEKTEVTQGAFARFCEETEGGWRNSNPPDVPKEQPVTGVSFFDAQAYAAWRSAGKPGHLRLPTEAQWARAAYGAESATYPWGPQWEEDAAKLRGVGEEESPAPVMSFEKDRSLHGCYDMTGNVSEWTRSFNDPAQAAAFGDEPGFGSVLIVRGGHYAESFTLRDRFPVDYATRNPAIGFRCVAEIPETPEAVRQMLRLAR